jgi:hypothetical protein
MLTFNLHTWTALAIVVMLAVITFMDWVPTPLNRNIHGMSVRERLPSTLIHGTVGFIAALANLFVVKWLIVIGALWFSVVLFAAIRNWWVAYFAGVHTGEITPEIYAQHYAKNLTVLPRFNGHPMIPDVQHTLIHLTVLAACVLSWISFFLA